MICCQQCCLSNWFSKFNGEGGTVQYHLTIKYIQHFIQFYTFCGSVWVLFNYILLHYTIALLDSSLLYFKLFDSTMALLHSTMDVLESATC